MIIHSQKQARHKQCKKMLTLLCVAVALLILAGCEGTIEIYQIISPNGSTSRSMNGSLDLTPVYEAQGAPRSSYQALDAEAKGPLCSQVSVAINSSDASCDLREAILTFSGTKEETRLNGSDGFSVKRGWFMTEYVFRPNSTGFASGNTSEGPNLSQIAALRESGIVMKYLVEMPGDVREVIGGKIISDGHGKSIAEIDAIDVMLQGATISVISQEFTSLLGWFFFGGFVLILVAPLIRWLIHRQGGKAVYKDKPGTLRVVFVTLPLILSVFSAFAVRFFISGPESQMNHAIAAFAGSMAFALCLLRYLGTGFQVTDAGIEYRTAFATKVIPFSKIQKIERATAGLGFSSGMRPAYLVTTTSGARIKPTRIEKGSKIRGGKGVLIIQRDKTTTYYPVRDIGWVIEAVKERI